MSQVYPPPTATRIEIDRWYAQHRRPSPEEIAHAKEEAAFAEEEAWEEAAAAEERATSAASPGNSETRRSGGAS